MKTKHGIFFGFAVTLAAAIFTLAGCPGGGSGGSSVSAATYTGTAGGATYKLTITAAGKAAYTPKEGDNYELTVGGKRSTGEVDTFAGGSFTLKPKTGGTFTATVSGSGLTGMSGSITFDGDTTATVLPDELTPTGNDDNSGDNGNSDNGNDDNGGNVPTTNGSLTITGIPSEYNGKYFIAMCASEDATGPELIAVDSVNADGNFIAARITNGRATLKVYRLTGNLSNITVAGGYSGSETLIFVAGVLSNSVVTFDSKGNPSNMVASTSSSSTYASVKFTNGNGEVSVAGLINPVK
jgi:hypothetical protein